MPALPQTGYTINLDDRSICLSHIDHSNLATGLCLVCPLGNFNHELGGQIVLQEPRMIVEVPVGGMILFPSAIIAHGNISVEEKETRTAITSYCAGTLFQFVENGFEAVGQLTNERQATGEQIWSAGLARYPNVSTFFQ